MTDMRHHDLAGRAPHKAPAAVAAYDTPSVEAPAAGLTRTGK